MTQTLSQLENSGAFIERHIGPDAAQQQGLLDYLTTQVPLGRMGQPEDIAKAAVFLASDDSAFVNGIELFADGGQAQV